MRVLLMGTIVLLSALAGCLGAQEDFQVEPRPSGSGGTVTNGDEDDSSRDPSQDDGDLPDGGPSNESDQETAPDRDSNESLDPEYNPPVAFIEPSHSEFFVPFTVSFELDGWDPDGEPITWSLDFGDGNRTMGNRLPVNIDHTYENEGIFETRLLVSDGTELTRQKRIIEGSVKPVPVEFGGNILLPEQFDLLGEECIAEGVVRSIIDGFNSALQSGNDALEEANDNISELNSATSTLLSGLLSEVNGTIQLLNQTVYEASDGEISIPYENPNLTAPSIPFLPSIPVTLNYLDGATWNIHPVDAEYWGWHYGFDNERVMAQYWAENGTVIAQGTAGNVPGGAAWMVVCMTSIPTDEEEFQDWVTSIPVDQEYNTRIEPPQELLQKPGPEDTPSQEFEGEFSVGACFSEYAPELEGVLYTALAEIDPETRGLPYQASFSATGVTMGVVEFFGPDGSLESHMAAPLEEGIEGVVPAGATQAFFSACGGFDIEVTYLAG